MKPERLFMTGAFVLVGAALVLGFLFIGTPGHARQLAMDQKRVDDLRDIALQLDRRSGPRTPLPAQLPAEIKAEDPFTHRSYEYARLSARRYELCAKFSARASGDDDARPSTVWNGDWNHPAGRVCFSFDVSNVDAVPSGHTPK